MATPESPSAEIRHANRSVCRTPWAAASNKKAPTKERCLIHALEEKLPVLGICRGAQLINVHFHGTLHGDIKAFYGEAGNPDSIYPRKQLALTEGSRLRRIIDLNKVYVNSLHQQAVNHLGDELQICGRDKADVVQAIENPDHPFLIGVQWHPEYLPALHSQQRLFQALVREAYIRSSVAASL